MVLSYCITQYVHFPAKTELKVKMKASNEKPDFYEERSGFFFCEEQRFSVFLTFVIQYAHNNETFGFKHNVCFVYLLKILCVLNSFFLINRSIAGLNPYDLLSYQYITVRISSQGSCQQ